MSNKKKSEIENLIDELVEYSIKKMKATDITCEWDIMPLSELVAQVSTDGVRWYWTADVYKDDDLEDLDFLKDGKELNDYYPDFEIIDLPETKAGCIHVEGVTPIDGWFICKKCGINLRKVVE